MRIVVFAMFALSVWAQSNMGVISGVVTDHVGAIVKGAPVQAANMATGATIRRFSTAKGDYILPKVPAGKYVVSVTMPGFSFLPFFRPDVAVQAGQTLKLNISLPEGPSLGTLGDDPARSRTKTPAPAGPAPRTAYGKPDLSGVWQGNDDPFPEQPELLPAVAARAKHMLETEGKDHPGARCLPPAAVVNGPFLYRIVQSRDVLLTIFEDVPGYRQVYLDGRAHPKDPNPTWLGHSTGKWEGDTLVIDTLGFNEGWIGFNPSTEKLHVTERYRRRDLGRLDIKIEVADPGAYARPWTINTTWELDPKAELLEYVCGENNVDPAHMVGK